MHSNLNRASPPLLTQMGTYNDPIRDDLAHQSFSKAMPYREVIRGSQQSIHERCQSISSDVDKDIR